MIAKDQPKSRNIPDLLTFWSQPTIFTWVQDAIQKAISDAGHKAVFDAVKVGL